MGVVGINIFINIVIKQRTTNRRGSVNQSDDVALEISSIECKDRWTDRVRAKVSFW